MSEKQYAIPWRDWIISGKTKTDAGSEFLTLLLPTATVINIQETAEYVGIHLAAGGSWWWSDYPMPVAPFPQQWLEYKQSWKSTKEQVGILVTRIRLEDVPVQNRAHLNGIVQRESSRALVCLQSLMESDEQSDNYIPLVVGEEREKAINRLTKVVTQVMSDVQWIQFMQVFIGTFNRVVCSGPVSIITLFVNERGDTYGSQEIPPQLLKNLEQMKELMGSTEDEIHLAARSMAGLAGAAMMALSQLNTKNVEIVDVAPEKELRRAFAIRNRGHRICTYKVLKVNSTLKIRPGVEDKLPSGAGVAEHRVRGHFAYYGDCAPDGVPRGKLFGKYTCRLWIESHIRGTVDHGVVVKDYEVTK
jgi:hypothetical protein